MSLNSDALKLLVAKGFNADDLVALALCLEKAYPVERSAAAKRQARYRAKRSEGVTNGVTRDVTDNPPNDNTLTPGSEAKASKPCLWACPIGVDPQHWADFRKNRKRKNCTDSETAHRAVMRDLETFSDDEWPPGRLVQRSAENGWAKIVNPREDKFGKPSHERPDNPTAIALQRVAGAFGGSG